MDTPNGQRGRLLRSLLTRRTLLQGAAVGGGALAVAAMAPAGRGLAEETPAANTDVSGTLTSWGFGVEETNPLAFARVNAFKKAFPKIQLEVVPEFDNQKLLTAAASKTVPDLLWLDRFETASWASRHVLMPLGDLIERDDYDTSRFYEPALAEATVEDEVYGIPGGMDVRGLYVNLDALTEVGVDPGTLDTGNWDQLSELGGKLTKRDGNRVERWGFDTKAQAGGFNLWGPANGGRFLSDDAQEATFDDPKLVDALDWAVRAYDAQGGGKLYDSVATTWQGDEQVARGQVAMSIYESWLLGIISRVAPKLNFTVLPIKKRGGDEVTSFAGGRGWYIPQGAKNVDAAWDFIKFMHTDDTWLIGAKAVKAARDEKGEPYIPSLTGSKTADALQIEQVYTPIAPQFDAAVKLWPELLAKSPTREFARSPVGDQLNDMLDQEGIKPALHKEKGPEDALKAADAAAQDAIDSF